MRKLRPNPRTTFRFIASDDEAITNADNYQNYLETLDEGLLGLTGTPTFYWLRPMPMDLFRRAQDALFVDGDDEARAERFSSEETFSVVRDVIDRCLVGCDNHEFVTEIRSDGSFVTESVRWPVGSTRPDGLLDLITEDRPLALNMFIALLRAASLTEKEKKR